MRRLYSLPGQVVYLAGPMSGLPFEVCRAWRDTATAVLQSLRDPRTKEPLYHVLNPLRGHETFVGKVFSAEGGFDDDSAAKVDIRRDRYDVLRSHIVLANLEDAERIGKVSIGTLYEIVWAHEAEKFIIVVMGKSNPHCHSFVRDSASLLVPDLDTALRYMSSVLNVSEIGDSDAVHPS
jgi:hypothetical protein